MQQRGLAASGRADDCDELAALDLEIEPSECPDRSTVRFEGLAKVPHAHHGVAGGHAVVPFPGIGSGTGCGPRACPPTLPPPRVHVHPEFPPFTRGASTVAFYALAPWPSGARQI